LDSLNNSSRFYEVIASAILGTRANTDYIGNVFDNTLYYDALMIVKTHRSSQKKERNSTYGAPSIMVPFTYDRMVSTICLLFAHNTQHSFLTFTQLVIQSKWSIIFDFALEFHCCVRELKARDVMEYILFVICCTDISLVAEIMRCILATDTIATKDQLDAVGLYAVMTTKAKAVTITTTTTTTYNRSLLHGHVDLTSDQLLKLCQEATKSYNKKNRKDVGGICFNIFEQVTDKSFASATGIDFDTTMAKDFIQLTGLFGLIPLECMTWATVLSKEDSLSKTITDLSDIEDLEGQRKLFHELKVFLKKYVSAQATDALMENILKAYEINEAGDEAARLSQDVYFYQPHRKQPQHFFRLKLGSKWELRILRNRILGNPKTSRTVTLTRWMDEGDYLHWVRQDGMIVKDSQLVMHQALRDEFFEAL